MSLELLPKVERNFFEDENLHFTEVLHIAGIYFTLIDNNLYFIKNAKNVVSGILYNEVNDKTDYEITTTSNWNNFNVLP